MLRAKIPMEFPFVTGKIMFLLVLGNWFSGVGPLRFSQYTNKYPPAGGAHRLGVFTTYKKPRLLRSGVFL